MTIKERDCSEEPPVTINLYVLLLPKLLMLDFIGPVEVFNFANRYSQQQFKLHFIGPNTDMESGMGLKLQIEPLAQRIHKNSWLLVPGLEGDEIISDSEQGKLDKVLCWIGNAKQFDKIVGVCAGTLLLGLCGILKHKQCTTHHAHLEQLKKLEPDAKVIGNRLFVQDGNLYTSAGVSAGIDLALYLVEKVCGTDCALKIARNLVLFSRRTINEPAESPWLDYRNHLHQRVHLIQDTLQAEPSKDWSVKELANMANCSPRHLTRMFKEHTNVSCKRYLQILRMNLATQFLEEQQLSIEQISLKVGYKDVRQFRRIWQQFYDVSPAAYKDSK